MIENRCRGVVVGSVTFTFPPPWYFAQCGRKTRVKVHRNWSQRGKLSPLLLWKYASFVFSRREGRNWSRLGIFFRHVARGKLEWRRSRVEGKQRRDSREERKKKSEGMRISSPSSAIRYVWRRATDTLWVRIVGVSDRIGHPCVIHRIP